MNDKNQVKNRDALMDNVINKAKKYMGKVENYIYGDTLQKENNLNQGHGGYKNPFDIDKPNNFKSDLEEFNTLENISKSSNHITFKISS